MVADRADPSVGLLSDCAGSTGSRGSLEDYTMIVLGIILLVIGYIVPIPILYTLGSILVVIGLILLLLGAVGRPMAGRRYWY